MLVSLNVYDVTNTPNENTNGMISRLNSITRELNLGGVFHGAIEIDGLEWSFGYCESGTGVYCCHARSNSLYTFREHLDLGETNKTRQEIREILTRFKRVWPGTSYDLLQRNCCHFCDDLCAALEVPRPPAWLNRFAQGADATVKFTNEASALARRVSANISFTAQQSASWLRDLSQRVMSQISQGTESDGGPSTGGIPLSRDDSPSGSHTDRTTGFGPAGCIGAEPSSRSEPTGVGPRLANRLRALAGTGTGGAAGSSGGAGSGGLPASTHASSSDLVSEQHRQTQSMSLPSALRQKWQELEASAGDGTKQFLFGLIKTRQSKLDDEDDLGLVGGVSAARLGDSASWGIAAPGGLFPRDTSSGAFWPGSDASQPPMAPPMQVMEVYPAAGPDGAASVTAATATAPLLADDWPGRACSPGTAAQGARPGDGGEQGAGSCGAAAGLGAQVDLLSTEEVSVGTAVAGTGTDAAGLQTAAATTWDGLYSATIPAAGPSGPCIPAPAVSLATNVASSVPLSRPQQASAHLLDM